MRCASPDLRGESADFLRLADQVLVDGAQGFDVDEQNGERSTFPVALANGEALCPHFYVGVLSPIVHTILVPLAHHTALARGTDVDKPRHLAKSVTGE